MASNTSIPIIVQGNSFALAIPLQIYVIDENEMVLQDYTPDTTDEVSIQLKGSRRNYTYTPTIDGNVANINLGGYELADNYAVVVSIVKANGQRLRSFRTDQFFIVESSDDLTQDDIIAGLEENVIYLNAQAFIAGADGRGITSIVKTGTSGLVDTYTITYTDNTTSTFTVTNGAQGATGADGASIASIAKTSTSGLVDTYTITLTNGDTSTFEVTNGMNGVDLGLANIVNDLTTGGATNVLSAEMGKVLDEGVVRDGLSLTTIYSKFIAKTPNITLSNNIMFTQVGDYIEMKVKANDTHGILRYPATPNNRVIYYSDTDTLAIRFTSSGTLYTYQNSALDITKVQIIKLVLDSIVGTTYTFKVYVDGTLLGSPTATTTGTLQYSQIGYNSTMNLYYIKGKKNGTDFFWDKFSTFTGATGITDIYDTINAPSLHELDTRVSILEASNTKNVLKPTIEMGRYNNTGIDTEWRKAMSLDPSSTTNVVYGDKTYWRIPNYIKLPNDSTFTIKASINVCFAPMYFDENFSWVASGVPAQADVSGGLDYTQLTANTAFSVADIPPTARYMKICFRSGTTSASLALDKFDVVLSGNFVEDYEVKNTASLDVQDYASYYTVATRINVTDPNCCDTKTDNVQDTPYYRFDYGVLALPKQYTNIGNPTRLIIFCHGASANYDLQSTRFGSAMDVRLWTSEGYAVLDIEGNPYDNTNEHGYGPYAVQSYLSAYDYVLKHFNIRNDGVLLAGISMGGGMTFDLLASHLPVIASCPVVPVCNYVWWWTYMNATRKAFVAQKLGFEGTTPTWTAGSGAVMSQAEWQYLEDNYNRWICYNPFTRMVTNTPTKAELMNEDFRVASNITTPNASETALWGTRIAKARCPIKIFVGNADTTVPPQRNGKFMFEMLRRGSAVVEYREFTSGGHDLFSAITADVVNSYGETIEDSSVTATEILNFWRRYDY
ncbi:MAG: alpha/beta hydrolase [Muribaculaceae bacterium]|nr:alpha/beta hydrolase [Muribaculaceae bacterium]